MNRGTTSVWAMDQSGHTSWSLYMGYLESTRPFLYELISILTKKAYFRVEIVFQQGSRRWTAKCKEHCAGVLLEDYYLTLQPTSLEISQRFGGARRTSVRYWTRPRDRRGLVAGALGNWSIPTRTAKGRSLNLPRGGVVETGGQCNNRPICSSTSVHSLLSSFDQQHTIWYM